MKCKSFGKLAIAAAAAAAVVHCTQTARASTKYWDIDGAGAPGAGGATPAGVWDTSSANWTTDPGGFGTSDIWFANDDAVFAAGGDATGAYTVTIAGTQSVNSITVEEGTITQGKVLPTDGIIDFGAANGVFTIASGATWNNATGTIFGTNGITFNGAGVLKLGGANTFNRVSGALLTVNGGTAEFTADAGLGAAPAAVNAAALTLNNGSTLRYTGTGHAWAANRGITVAGNVTIDTAAQSTTTSGLSMPSAAGGAVITGPGSAVITKTGPGRFTLNLTSNAYQGKWKVTGGVLNIGGEGRLGATPGAITDDYVTLDGGGLRIGVTSASSIGVNRGITLGAGGGKIIMPGGGTGTGANTLTVNSKISGTAGGNLTVDWQDTASSTSTGGSSGSFIVLNNAGNSYNGSSIINANTTLRVGVAGAVPDASLVTTTSSSATFDVNGLSETVKSISGTAGTVLMTATSTLTLNDPAGETTTQTLNVAQGGKIVKNGSGAITLNGGSGNNNATTGFRGEFVLNAGTLGFGTGTMLGGANTPTATLTINGGNLANPNSANVNMNAALITNLSGDFSVDASLNATPGPITFNGGTQTIRGGDRTISVGAGANLTFAGVVAEDVAGRGLTKAGAGTIILTNAANLYSGNTTVAGGILQVDGDATLGSGAGTLTLSGGTLNTSANRSVAAPNPVNLTADSVISTTSAATSVEFEFSSNTFGGTAGTLTFRNDGADGAGDTFQPRLSGNGFDFTRPIVIDNGATGKTELRSFNGTGTTQTFSNVISGSGSYRRSGSGAGSGGETVLTGNNTYTGGTSLADGTIALGSDGAISTGTLSIAPLGLSSVPTIYAFGGPRSLGNAVAFTNTTAAAFVIGGANNLTLSGTVDLGGASRTVKVDNTAATEFSGVISGGTGFGLTKSGDGTLKLSGVNTYDGGTTVSAGTLVLGNADALAGGAVEVKDGALAQAQAGLPKAVTVTTLATNATGKFDITDNSMVVKGMSVNDVENLVGFNLGEWNGAGIVSSTAENAIPAVTAIGVGNAGQLSLTSFKGVEPLAGTETLVKYTYYGDNDLSGATDVNDFTQFVTGLQTGGTTWYAGDYDYNGSVTLDDFSLFLLGFQQQGAPLSELVAAINGSSLSAAEQAALLAMVSAIPEPTGLGLLGLAGAGLLARRRRR